LLDQINAATLAYEAYYTNKTAFELDFEFKRMAPGDMMVKQIRAVPHPVQVPPPTITSGVFTVTNDYMVVDLSGGPAATHYPVSTLSAVPVGGWTDEYKSTKLVLRRIPAGGFSMGSPPDEYGRSSDEPQHAVILSENVFIGVFEVTQKQWERVMGDWPSFFTNATCRDTRPAEQVSYNDIRGTGAGWTWPESGGVDTTSFMGKLRARTGRTFDLPTESQWEYAGRAGVGTSLNSGYDVATWQEDANMSAIGRYWYNGGSNWDSNADTAGATAKVGSYPPNQWGLYDIHGNVWEWCLDNYVPGYPAGPVVDPKGGPDTGNVSRVWRGGAWNNDDTRRCRIACRAFRLPDHQLNDLGFRIAVPPGP
jgi:formylglycine-generating enzyme required for sulfatase activity